MNLEQNDTGLFQWAPTLNGDPPEILVECQHDARLRLRQIQQGDVAFSGEIRAGPQNVVAVGSKRLYIGFGKFSSARRRIYAGIGKALYSWAR